jgi:hypothetical protein
LRTAWLAAQRLPSRSDVIATSKQVALLSRQAAAAGDDAGVVADTLDVGAGFVVLVDGSPGEAEDHVVVGLFEFGGAAAFEFEGEFEVDGEVAEFAFEDDDFALA